MNEGAGHFVYHATHTGCLKFTSVGSDPSVCMQQADDIWTVLTESPQGKCTVCLSNLVTVCFLKRHVNEKSDFHNGIKD